MLMNRPLVKMIETTLIVGALCLSLAFLMACGKSLNGTYVNAPNRTIEFSSDGSCVVQDNGVAWPGHYTYDNGSNSFKVTTSELGGTVGSYTLKVDGQNLVLVKYGYEFIYEPYDVWASNEEANLHDTTAYYDDEDFEPVGFDEAYA